MASSKYEAQCQGRSHVTFEFMWYFLKKKTINHNLATRIA